MTPRALAHRRRVLLTMLTTLGFRYPPGREPPVITGIRQYLGGWPGVGRIVAGMARQQYDLRLTRYGQSGCYGAVGGTPGGPSGRSRHLIPAAAGGDYAAGVRLVAAFTDEGYRRLGRDPQDRGQDARDRAPDRAKRRRPE